jgi:DNA polymerase I-like protein with 3'-5' exonuclease and polymerase domains
MTLVLDMNTLPASLRGQGAIGIDLETSDPDLKTRGPGPHRGGYICGVAIGTEAGFRAYLPVAHGIGPNLDKRKVFSWLGKQLKLPVPKIGARLVYDLGFLIHEGVPFVGPFYDIQVAEPLLDENQFVFSLDRISEQYLGEKKKGDDLDAYLIQHFGKKNPRNNIARAPATIVGPYACGDVDLPLRIFPKQKKELERQGLWDLFLMESKLTELLARMHLRGVRVDLEATEQLDRDYLKEHNSLIKQIKRQTGIEVSVWAAASVAQVFDHLGLDYPLTPKTQKPSFTATSLDEVDHPIAAKVRRIRWLDKMRGTFLRGCILEGHHEGRVHSQFNQLKSDQGGTVTGRFSSSLPNMQFIPTRTEESKKVRSAFLPDADHLWLKTDYSQVEYRLIAHDAFCAGLKGADKVVRQYTDDPSTDFHKVIAIMTGIDRPFAKTINFGLAYGEGVAKLATQLGLTISKAEVLLKKYHDQAPFIRPLSQLLSNMAGTDGEIRTLLQRKRRFNMWIKNQPNGAAPLILPHKFPGSSRAFLHKSLNARIQGSAADIMKKSMVEVAESGVFDVTGVPHLTVHDELDFSIPRGKAGREAAREIRNIMQNCVSLSVPLKVDTSVGKDWGQVEDIEL